MVSQLEVSVVDSDTTFSEDPCVDRAYCRMKRIHAKDGKPFCFVDIRLDNTVFTQSPNRFQHEIVVTVLYVLLFVKVGVDLTGLKPRTRFP